MNKVITEQYKNAMHDLMKLAAHELLTPVSALKGLVYLMQTTPEDLDDRNEYIFLLDYVTDRIHRTINYVLLFENFKNEMNVYQSGKETLINQLFLSPIIKHSKLKIIPP